MPVDPLLTELLACPRCKGRLEFHEEEREIRCPACRVAYPIEDGIPVMLVNRARPLGDPQD